MNAVLLDSDVAIEVLRQRDDRVQSRWAELAASDALLLYSPVTAAEVWHGTREGERESVSAWFAVMTCVPINSAIGAKAGDYLRQFHRSHSVELGDALIAATASIHLLRLWTRNRKHYPMKDIQLF
ncbi:MAG TPA: type II toxin-antitoxin system VapC family toxin [Bryobacteraceae bacterium]|nr:type II toxin-antitoxin system VapC family toxin [Bryobacteraceae bacterium]